MTVETLFIIMMILLLLLIFAGMYIHSTLLAVGVIGLILLEGPGFISGFLQSDPFIRTASYSLTTVPMFVLMAQFIVRTGVVEDLFTMVYNASRGRSGVLGVLTVLAGGLMGAVSGSSNASAGALGNVAIPQLLKRGFNEGIAGATVATAGSLSSVIPPSIIFILWGVATETPIGELFIGTLIPGIIIIIITCFTMLIFHHYSLKNRKQLNNKVEKFEKEYVPTSRLISATLLLSIIALAVFFGIYAGIFTPTEAGAVGAFVAFIAALILKKVNIEFFKESFSETVKLTSMILMIMIGAQIFGRFVSISLLPRKIIELLSTIIEYPLLILVILVVFYFIAFMLVEGSAVIVMTAPIVLPLINEIGMDPLWFGILVGVLCTIGLLSPPVGLSVFSVSGVTGISSDAIFKYALPFAVIITIIIVPIMIIFPEVATWLPSQMSK
nr:TRAP transporter large permease [Fredinandcohnia onubensis]